MPKGFEGAVRIRPESDGWGSAASPGEGHFLFADSESISPNQEFKDRPEKITIGMAEKLNSRTKGPQKPGGDVTYQPRSNDLINMAMSHFQKYIGEDTADGDGTSTYTFVPCRLQPDWVGSTYGTGAYLASEGDMFVNLVDINTSALVAGTNNTKRLTNAFADQLVFESAAGEDVKVTPTFKSRLFSLEAKDVSAPASSGSYSALSPFEFFEGTLTVDGRTDLEITNFSMTSSRNSEDRPVLGNLNPTKYDFGRYVCEGVIQIDAPEETLWHLGSMILNETFAIAGTWFNSANDLITISIPNAKYQPFDVNISAGDAQLEYGLAWKAYESNDGSTSPITMKVITMGMGSAFDVIAV